MVKEEKFLIAKYTGIAISAKDSVGLRGFFADIDYNATAVHNHTADGASVYRYPQVQYKTSQGHPLIIAFGDGIKAVYPMIMEHADLNINGTEYKNPEMHIELKVKKVGDSAKVSKYRFVSPWIGLNQENYRKYQILEEEEEKHALLNRILIGNILSLCKGFGITIENKLSVENNLVPMHVRYKGEHMIGFRGEFSVNAEIPSLCGIGKGVSLGYGTVIRDRKGEEAHERTDICRPNL